jgi:hypothetical protein
METKVYGGLIVLASLLALALWQFVFKKQKAYFFLFVFSLILGLATYLPASKATTNFVKWEPFWFLRSVIQAPDRMNWVNLELRRQTYQAYNSTLMVLVIDLVAFFSFFVGNLGTRLLGIKSFFKKALYPFKARPIDLFLLLLFFTGIVPTMLFLQEYLPWNTIQFFYYSIFIFSFFAASGAASLFAKIKFKWLKIGLFCLILFFSLPSTLKTISWHWSEPPTSFLGNAEIEALEFLKNASQKTDLVLAFPFVPGTPDLIPPPVPLSYYNAAYISFFANRHLYLEDQTVATIQGYGLNQRLNQIKFFFSTKNASKARQFLDDKKIRFIYLVDQQSWQADLGEKVDLAFENKRARIYQVRP